MVSPIDRLKFAAIVLPVIVVRGRLFVASYDRESEGMKIEEAKTARLHWRGSQSWRLHTTIDIVTEEALEDFSKRRSDEAYELARTMNQSLRHLRRCVAAGDLAAWPIIPGPRGFKQPPALLRDLQNWLGS